jgi:glutathione S-transferase
MGGKSYIAGDRLSMADIFLFPMLDFLKTVGQPIDPAHKSLTAWYERMKARPSAAA